MPRFLVAGLTVMLSLAAACEEKKKPLPALDAVPSASAPANPTEQAPAVAAYPPGMAPPEDAGSDAAPAAPKTGVCAFDESGYDGPDTKSNEKMVVKIKDDKIVGAVYSYRGSYAIDGKTDQLDMPLLIGKWLEFEVPMTAGGSKTFKIKIKDDFIEFKGVATEGADGNCQWEKPDKDKDKKDKKDKKK